jgi:hypothetical protein
MNNRTTQYQVRYESDIAADSGALHSTHTTIEAANAALTKQQKLFRAHGVRRRLRVVTVNPR